MKRKAIIPLVLGLGVGLFAVKLAVDTIRKAQAAGAASKTIDIVRAKIDINAHEMVTPEMIELVETAEDSALVPQAERFEDLNLVVGRVTAKSIPANSPILKSMLSPEGTPAGMVGRIPIGYRAISVKIDEVSSVAYQLKPGDWVDVLVVMDIDTGIRGKKETVSEVILQNIQVAAIGNTTNPPQGAGATKTKPAKSATLFVRIEDVPKLNLANTRGRVSLAMRGSDDPSNSMGNYAGMADVLHRLKPKKKKDDCSPFMASLGFCEESKDDSKAKLVDAAITQQEIGGPHTVLVVRGGSATENMQRIEFFDANSSQILSVSAGAGNSSGIGSSKRR